MGSTTLNRALLTDTAHMGIVTDALGDNTNQFADVDIGKGVKLAAAAYVPLALGDEIEGIVNTINPAPTVNSGFSHGGIQRTGRAIATVGAAQTSTITVGGYVCADTPIALGTAGTLEVLDTGTGYVAPTMFLWRVIRILSGTGIVGDSVLIERA